MYYGNILVKMSGSGSKWLGVCDDNFDIKDGNVICRMLGYPNATRVKTSSRYGKYETFSGVSIGKFALTELICDGTEASLEKCSYSIAPGKINNCTDTEYAGVECHHDSINIDDY